MKKIEYPTRRKGLLPSLKIALLLTALLLSGENAFSYDYMRVHPCRAMVNDSLCYLVKKGPRERKPEKKKWELFCGKISNFWYSEGYSATVIVDKYDLRADTIRMISDSPMWRLGSIYQYYGKADCDCEKLREQMKRGKRVEQCKCSEISPILFDHDRFKSDKEALNRKISAKTTVSGQVAGYDYVDLGLPSGTLWATCNVGATRPTERGDWFVWGDTRPRKDQFEDDDWWDTYKWSDGRSEKSLTKYCVDSLYGRVDDKRSLDTEDDMAAAHWGERWRMPTNEEAKELQESCSWEYTGNFNGTKVAGLVGTSKLNGNVIFLPNHIYWTSSLSDMPSISFTFAVCAHFGYKPYFGRASSYRVYCHVVRAVVNN